MILGVSSSIAPFAVDPSLYIDFIILIVITILIGIIIFLNKKDEKKFGRLEGLILVGGYIAYLVYIIMRN